MPPELLERMQIHVVKGCKDLTKQLQGLHNSSFIPSSRNPFYQLEDAICKIFISHSHSFLVIFKKTKFQEKIEIKSAYIILKLLRGTRFGSRKEGFLMVMVWSCMAPKIKARIFCFYLVGLCFQSTTKTSF
ncbi:unnamed protein product [Lathyrus oleraceus]